jgi:hypothetical protein
MDAKLLIDSLLAESLEEGMIGNGSRSPMRNKYSGCGGADMARACPGEEEISTEPSGNT